MSQPFDITNKTGHAPGPIETPCTAQCVNLQQMHPVTLKKLGLFYKQYYVIVRYELDPTPEHLGAWVRLQHREGYPTDWIPAHFFIINLVIWPN